MRNSLLPEEDVYDSLLAAETAINYFVIQQGYAVGGRRRSKRDNRGEIRKVWLCCAHGRSYDNHREYLTDETRLKQTSTRCGGCPWAVTIKREADSNDVNKRHQWRVTVENATHNHEAAVNPSVYPSARKLRLEDLNTIQQMTNAGAAPKAIVATLRQQNPDSHIISRDVYNARARAREKSLSGYTPLEALLDVLQMNNIMHDYQRNSDGKITHLFLALPSSIGLAREFPDVLLMDSTYKTNRFKMPLLHMIGTTCTHNSFSVGFCFMKNETDSDYAWALSRARGIYHRRQPKTIITDGDLALMNAVENIFRGSTHILRSWHIEKSIVANLKRHFSTKQELDNFLKVWKELIRDSIDETAFEANWERLQQDFAAHHPEVVAYLDSTWIPHKEKFVLAWTKRALHFGHLGTSRAEGKHGSVKGWIMVPTGDLKDVYEKMCLAAQHEEKDIRYQIAFNQANSLLILSDDIWATVKRRVSHYALKRAHQEYVKAKHLIVSENGTSCSGTLRTTMGLPCSHELKAMMDSGGRLMLEHFDQHWWLVKPVVDAPLESMSIKRSLPEISSIIQSQHDDMASHQQRLQQQHMFQFSQGPLLEAVQDPRLTRSRDRPVGPTADVGSTSTRRDPSLFETAERARRKCRICNQVGHNCRTCPERSGVDDLEGAKMHKTQGL